MLPSRRSYVSHPSMDHVPIKEILREPPKYGSCSHQGDLTWATQVWIMFPSRRSYVSHPSMDHVPIKEILREPPKYGSCSHQGDLTWATQVWIMFPSRRSYVSHPSMDRVPIKEILREPPKYGSCSHQGDPTWATQVWIMFPSRRSYVSHPSMDHVPIKEILREPPKYGSCSHQGDTTWATQVWIVFPSRRSYVSHPSMDHVAIKEILREPPKSCLRSRRPFVIEAAQLASLNQTDQEIWKDSWIEGVPPGHDVVTNPTCWISLPMGRDRITCLPLRREPPGHKAHCWRVPTHCIPWRPATSTRSGSRRSGMVVETVYETVSNEQRQQHCQILLDLIWGRLC